MANYKTTPISFVDMKNEEVLPIEVKELTTITEDECTTNKYYPQQLKEYASYGTDGFYPYADSFSFDYDVGYYNVPYYVDMYNLQDSNKTLEKEENYEREYSLPKEEVFSKNDDCNSLYEENQEMKKKLEEREREIERYEKMFTDSRKNEVRLDNINKELKERVEELREANAQMKKDLVYEKRISDNLRNECVRKEELIVRLQQARRSTYHPKNRKRDYDEIVVENEKLKREIFFFKETNMGLIKENKRRKISYKSDNESEGKYNPCDH